MSAEDRLKGKKILIVDDEPDVLESLEELLSECRVEKAQSFQEANQKLETDTFDLAILDIMGVDGYKLLETAVSRNVPAVMLTARALSPAHVEKSFREGAVFYLPKEEMVRIHSYLNDILEDLEAGRNTWDRWWDRLGRYCERHFGPEWQQGDKTSWERFPFY